MVQQILPRDVPALLAREPHAVLLDVREPWELQLATVNVPFVHAPLHSVPEQLPRLDAQGPILCLCHHGMRSLQVAHFLQQRGFDDVYNVAGGIDAWARTVDPSVPRY